MTTYERAAALLNEAETFPAGSLDWEYRRRSAWKLDQMNRGIPVCDWTEEPPEQTRKAA